MQHNTRQNATHPVISPCLLSPCSESNISTPALCFQREGKCLVCFYVSHMGGICRTCLSHHRLITVSSPSLSFRSYLQLEQLNSFLSNNCYILKNMVTLLCSWSTKIGYFCNVLKSRSGIHLNSCSKFKDEFLTNFRKSKDNYHLTHPLSSKSIYVHNILGGPCPP